MGRVTVVQGLHAPDRAEHHDFDGPLIDFLDDRFPEGLGSYSRAPMIVDANAGRQLTGEDWLEPVGDRTVAIALGNEPHLTPLIASIVSVASVVVSVAVSFLLGRPGTTADQAAPGSVYSVTAQANTARLGGIIPVQYGRFTRTPEYASESYRTYVNNEEVRYFLLSLGAGDYQVNSVRLGNTDVTDLPTGLVDYTLYNSADHTSTLGVIDADFGIHENVITSGDVDEIEVDGGTLAMLSNRTVSATSGGSQLDVQGEIDVSNVSSGDKVRIIGNTDSSIDGLYTISNIANVEGNGVIIIDETFPATVTLIVVELEFSRDGAVERGPFTTNPPGTLAETLELDFDFPQGIFIQNDDGDFVNLTLQFQTTVQEIDDAGADVGAPQIFSFSVTNSTNTPQRLTQVITPSSPGRFRVSVQRTETTAIDARDADQSIWTGLKAFIQYDLSQTVYGDVAILALKVTGAEQISQGSQQRIFVDSTRIINNISTDTPVAGGNLADVYADIIVDQNYGARGSTAEYNQTDLLAFRTAQASRSGFNGVFDERTTVWRALEAVTALGYARPYPRGFALSVVVDEAKPNRSSIITPDNMVADSFSAQYNWIEPADNDGVQVEYREATTGNVLYKVFPTDALDPENRRIIGLTDDNEALSQATYLWRQKTLRNLQVTWSMELDGENLTPFERLGVAFPLLDWGDGAYVVAQNGSAVTLSQPAPSGPLSVIFRDQNGSASAVLAATGDGTETIAMVDALPFTLVSDGQSAPTLAAFDLTANFDIQDVAVTAISRGQNRTRIQAVNYTDALYTGLV